MRRFVCAIALLAALSAPISPSAAQGRSEARTTVSLSVAYGGAAALWSVDRQPVIVPSTARFATPRFDTLRLSRSIDPGFALGVGFTWFPRRLLGIQLATTYTLAQVSTRCTVVFEDLAVDTSRVNGSTCASLSSTSLPASALLVDGSAVLRMTPAWELTPSLRVGGGFSVRQYDPIGVAGASIGGLRTVYRAGGTVSVRPALHGAVGVTSNASPGLQLRFELGAHLLRVPYVTGPAAPGAEGIPPRGERWIRQLQMSISAELVLDQRRGRRY